MIVSRRGVIAGAAGLAAFGYTDRLTAAAPATARLVYDPRYAHARRVAESARAMRMEVLASSRDLVGPFTGEYRAWLADGRPLLGVTGYADFVMMRDLARDHRRVPGGLHVFGGAREGAVGGQALTGDAERLRLRLLASPVSGAVAWWFA